ncbi:MlaD family protein [Balneolaceae bacterium ANBcel3]|nr:MlaD family protein [Balneolaceae bacterium ANBcel3]
MRKVQNEIKIGLTIVIAMLVAVIGFRFMQDIPLFRPGVQLITYFERVDGISTGSSVHLSGVKVGSVGRIELEGPNRVRVELYLTYSEGVPVGSKAVIEASDLIGGKHIRLYFSDSDEMIPDGGTIEGGYATGAIEELGGFAEEIKPDVLRTTHNLAELLDQFNVIMKEGAREDIQLAIEGLKGSSVEVHSLIQDRKADLDQSIQSLSRFLANMDTLSTGQQGQLEQILTNLEDTSRELASISRELEGVSSELHLMMQAINEGEGTIGKLIRDPSLYDNLDATIGNLKDITEILKDDPRHFLKHMRLIDIF